MQNINVLILTVLMCISYSLNADPVVQSYQLNVSPGEGLAGNGITDIFAGTRTVWLGTGHGLSFTKNNGKTIQSLGTAHGIGRGSISAMWVSGDTVIVATANDTLTQVSDDYLANGTGLSISLDNGQSWKHIKQPPFDFPTVQNLTYDIAVLNGTIWLANFGGGLVKGENFGENWEVVPPDSFVFDPGKRLNHRAFSVITADNELWVGTAEGINKSVDGGKTWENFSRTNQEQPISGNFVNALAFQKAENRKIIWASTWKAEGETEFYAVSKSENGGKTWTTTLGDSVNGIRPANFCFDGSIVYVATYEGLYKSADFGETWCRFPRITDTVTGEKVYSTELYSVMAQNGVVWAGTSDGLAKTSDNGYTWDVMRAFQPTGEGGRPRTYAYPNPFSPTRHNVLDNDGYVRIQYNTTLPTRVTIRIYDFAMDLVTTLVDGKIRYTDGDFNEVWNGRNDYGDMVANGVYFYSVEIDNDGTYWGKIMIVN
ncbi:hypothetical protein JXQ31_09100 [candidate division KSB1 bacterium]|nr:hypothetical protein [candidate division KSB1 bacterium]